MLILTVPWDFRALWASLMFSTRAYLVLLFISTIYIVLSLIRGQLALHDSTGARTQPHFFRSKQSFLFLRLLFGLVLADGVFGALRAVEHSRSSLSEYTLTEALQPLTPVSFVVFSLFLLIHVAIWMAQTRGAHER